MTRITLGKSGEEAAARFLEGKGYRILARNWRCGRRGEIDLVAMDGDEVVFVEVKTRSDGRFGEAAAQITAFKASQLRRLAWMFLRAHRLDAMPYRIDVIGIRREGKTTYLRHVVSAIGGRKF